MPSPFLPDRHLHLRSGAGFRGGPVQLARCVEGYGIDAFLLQAAARAEEPIVPVRLARTKHHAPSFPHLPVIFVQAVPVLLHPAVSGLAPAPKIGTFRLTDRELPARQLTQGE